MLGELWLIAPMLGATVQAGLAFDSAVSIYAGITLLLLLATIAFSGMGCPQPFRIGR